jgi:hypothetical protein
VLHPPGSFLAAAAAAAAVWRTLSRARESDDENGLGQGGPFTVHARELPCIRLQCEIIYECYYEVRVDVNLEFQFRQYMWGVVAHP